MISDVIQINSNRIPFSILELGVNGEAASLVYRRGRKAETEPAHAFTLFCIVTMCAAPCGSTTEHVWLHAMSVVDDRECTWLFVASILFIAKSDANHIGTGLNRVID